MYFTLFILKVRHFKKLIPFIFVVIFNAGFFIEKAENDLVDNWLLLNKAHKKGFQYALESLEILRIGKYLLKTSSRKQFIYYHNYSYYQKYVDDTSDCWK